MKFALQLVVYQLLLMAFLPLALLLAKRIDRRAGQQRWKERFGFYPDAAGDEPAIWFHAASVGEAKMAGVLMQSLRSEGYQGRCVVTTTTETGAATIAPLLHPQDRHYYSPYDAAWSVQRAIRHIRPTALVVFEKEIWPNLWYQVDEAGAPIIVSNANLSERSLRRYRTLCFELLRDAVERVHLVLAQSSAAAERFISLGARPERVQVAGNLKYALVDATLTTDQEQSALDLGKRLIWLAASTHAGEEEMLISCHQTLLQQYPELLLVIVPRHPQRFAAVAELCDKSGLRYQRRSQDSRTQTSENQSGQNQTQSTVAPQTQLYLADTLGELNQFYAMADLAVVCGSFVAVGGHNILEPAAAGCPIIVGPDMANARDILADFLQQDALIQVENQATLLAALEQLLAQPARRRQLSEHARQLLHDPTHQRQHAQARSILAALKADH